ncbi:MAG: serine/threonine protein kinase [Lentisphaeraceae bacterium]|nr:serine/threonine protein kinase [Lentisphaeraceae bacterium]
MNDKLKEIKGINHYKIVREIAEGGMGTVYEASQMGVQGFEKRVAVKTLLNELYEDERFIDMFIDEAKLVANLVHENIVQIYQLGKADFGYYIVMELVNGIPLHDLIDELNEKQKLMPVELAVFITSRIARALSYAHSRTDKFRFPLNIVHRDVCPNNILITTEGLPKLTDFGIAKARNNIMPANDQCLMGKLMYMPPEQALKKGTDHRGDIYALGIVLFELLSGHKGREGRTESETLELACQGCVDTDVLPELPETLLDILFKAIQVDPDERFQTTEEMCTALEYFIYKDGYGPTIVTLEKYLRKEFTDLYHSKVD